MTTAHTRWDTSSEWKAVSARTGLRAGRASIGGSSRRYFSLHAQDLGLNFQGSGGIIGILGMAWGV